MKLIASSGARIPASMIILGMPGMPDTAVESEQQLEYYASSCLTLLHFCSQRISPARESIFSVFNSTDPTLNPSCS